ncbi:hypothetical protein [Clostridium sp. MD294]|uniref:hypothetical protein n=1 Tax=Clostridium sp. MD294 TaxID=97138 RepID=UPI0002CC9170|nr:hypothetical protein [Clostridium sp. MD294]NDO46735.1 hypothetical protein [Clostridium sp. MD294]USF28824.1 hypothetical protein C820_000198 [Clostridium sp. MD294]
MNKMKKLNLFLIYVTVVIGITLLRISRGYPKELVQFLSSFVELTENIIGYFGLTKLFDILHSFSIKWILFCIGSIQIAVGFLILFLFRNIWEQGAMILLKKSDEVLKAGICLYVMLFAVIVMFVYSVVGLPIGAILLLLRHIAVVFGRIPIAIFLGYLLLQQFQIKGETYLYYIIGSFVMLLFENVYLIGSAFLFFVFPVIALGVDMLLIVYYFVYKCSFTVEWEQQKQKFDRNKMRNVIKGEK